MVTAKKTPIKAVKTPPKVVKEPVQEYRMPVEVADWIKQAESRITYLTTEVGRLKEENQSLRKANKVMEARVMGVSRE
jgi:hypothetical protein